ncbi:hypothetical protein AB4865_08465 [Capnocytophaga sp. ARDL2]|uniref:hypothetical protein n=1 Tax=Capnocytophaga sp. ARDL2 TaxID=3238809 RepID=UPI00355793C2
MWRYFYYYNQYGSYIKRRKVLNRSFSLLMGIPITIPNMIFSLTTNRICGRLISEKIIFS